MAARQLKYVIGQSGGTPTPIIFPAWLDHAEFASFHPTSAGTVQISADISEHDSTEAEAFCFGKSHTLDLESDPADSGIITSLLNKAWL